MKWIFNIDKYWKICLCNFWLYLIINSSWVFFLKIEIWIEQKKNWVLLPRKNVLKFLEFMNWKFLKVLRKMDSGREF